MSIEKKELKFKFGESVDALPERRYAKGSKFDAVLDSTFVKRFTEISIEGKDANYIRTQLVKRILSRKMPGLGVAVANGKCYIEKGGKVKTPTKKPKK